MLSSKQLSRLISVARFDLVQQRSFFVPVGYWYTPIPKRAKPWKGKGPWHEKFVNYEEIAIELRQRDHAFDKESANSILKRTLPAPGQVIKVDLPERPEDPLQTVSGAPAEHVYERRARIFVPPRNAMTSGTDATSVWRLEFDNRERWENPLMGWISTADPISNVYLQFDSKESAIEYCERQGYPYSVEEPAETTWKTKSYGANFAWNRRTRLACK